MKKPSNDGRDFTLRELSIPRIFWTVVTFFSDSLQYVKQFLPRYGTRLTHMRNVSFDAVRVSFSRNVVRDLEQKFPEIVRISHSKIEWIRLSFRKEMTKAMG